MKWKIKQLLHLTRLDHDTSNQDFVMMTKSQYKETSTINELSAKSKA